MDTFIHLIADYGTSDPAFSEVIHRLKYEDPDVTVQTTEVPPLSTVATGFWIEQLGLHNPAFEELVIYSNTAPRTEAATVRQVKDGGQLCYLELDTDVPVVAVNVGYNLSFIRDRLKTVRTVKTPPGDSQFRSRDYFPKRVVELADGNTESLGGDLSIRAIPPRPESVVCFVDGYGNIKTSIRASEIDVTANEIAIEINSKTRNIALRDVVHEIEEETIAMIPGSSGGDDPYMELFLRGGSAAAAFDCPHPGDEITITEAIRRE